VVFYYASGLTSVGTTTTHQKNIFGRTTTKTFRARQMGW